jgi:hypothetical protein
VGEPAGSAARGGGTAWLLLLREFSVDLGGSVVSQRFEGLPVYHGVTEVHGEFTERSAPRSVTDPARVEEEEPTPVVLACALDTPFAAGLGASATCDALSAVSLDVVIEWSTAIDRSDQPEPWTITPMVYPAGPVPRVLTAGGGDPVALDGRSGVRLAQATSSIQAETPTCGGHVGGEA